MNNLRYEIHNLGAVLFKLTAFVVRLSAVGDVDAYVGLPACFHDIYFSVYLMAALPKIMNYSIFTFVFSGTRKNR